MRRTISRTDMSQTWAYAAFITCLCLHLVAASSPSSASSYTSPSLFESTMLNVTNTFRVQHNASAVVWNKTLGTYAEKWAKTCNFQHSGGPYGENLAEGYANVTAAVDAWADEAKYYNYQTPTGFTEQTGHFTQLVWKATTSVGCAAVNCSSDGSNNNHQIYSNSMNRKRRVSGGGGSNFGQQRHQEGTILRRDGDPAFGWFIVCEYFPPGNIVGENGLFFEQNVQPSTSGAASTMTRSHPSPTSSSTIGCCFTSPSAGAGSGSGSGGGFRLCYCSGNWTFATVLGVVLTNYSLW